MKILVVSDTHGQYNRLLHVMKQEPDCDALIFLGDGMQDINKLRSVYPSLPMYVVKGNCDGDIAEPTQALVGIGGQLFFYCHGNMYGVKQSRASIASAARVREADIALFGHTHRPYYEYSDGLYLFNPGAISTLYNFAPSYGIITISDSVPKFFHKEYIYEG